MALSFSRLFFVLLLSQFAHEGFSAAPTLILQSYNSSDAIRPSGSSGGGLVKGIDSYVFYATATRDPTDSSKFLDTDIKVDVGINPALWSINLETCHTLAECPPAAAHQTGCYCEFQTGNDYNLVFKRVADDNYLGQKIRFRWLSKKNPFDPAYHIKSSSQKLPPISPAALCDPKKVTITFEGRPIQLNASGVNTLKKTVTLSRLTFRVSGLSGVYVVQIELDGLVLNRTKQNATISVIDSQSILGNEYNLSFVELSADACGRSGSYVVVTKKGPALNEDLGCGLICWFLVGIGILFFVGFLLGVILQNVKENLFDLFTKSKFTKLCLVVLCILMFGLGLLLGVLCAWRLCSGRQRRKQDAPQS